ncbi:MAG: nitrogenase component 1 [Methanospirillum sp.]
MEAIGAMAQARQVNENQCQHCMPLGGVIAFKGVAGAMVLVHGSQGCSTYMRLASVEHFNEPVDIASSSLNEKQTIHGGEANLRRAMDNVFRVYRPRVLGVLTTCLAETIGEDLQRIVGEYRSERSIDAEIVPVETPSYAGSHTEGYWAATRAVIARFARPTPRHGRINVIVPHISPADIREIKRLLELMGVEYTLLPDYSLTLDQPYGGPYRKIAPGGTSTEAIAAMPGATCTVQFGATCPEALSPGRYLEREHGVPLFNLPLPIGLENMDRFVETLRQIGGRPVPDVLTRERGWLLDAMADAHMINAEGRPAIFGEPETVLAVAGLCAENGAFPAVVATGSRSSRLREELVPVLAGGDRPAALLEAPDFTAIGAAAAAAGANIAVGHSGGRVLVERHGIPLLRIGFPVHDRIGGQRILLAGYAGTLAFLDRFANRLLETKHATYRDLRRREFMDQE